MLEQGTECYQSRGVPRYFQDAPEDSSQSTHSCKHLEQTHGCTVTLVSTCSVYCLLALYIYVIFSYACARICLVYICSYTCHFDRLRLA